MAASDRILFTKEIAALLRCSSKTVLRRFNAGLLPGATKEGKQGAPVRMRERDLNRYLRGAR